MSDDEDIQWQCFPLMEEFAIRSHIPPSPDVTNIRFSNMKNIRNLTKRERKRSSLGTVIHWPPLPGQDGEEEIVIKLLGELAPPAWDSQRLFVARVISAHASLIDEEAAKDEIVAEIFDPLSYDELDPSIAADMDYSQTTACYKLLKDFQGKSIPKYYGSYTMKLPLEGRRKGQHREIRLILREYIKGTSLDKLKPKRLGQEERKILMEKVIETEYEFDKRGIAISESLYSSYVILVNEPDTRIVFWCFIDALLGSDIEHPLPLIEPYPGTEGILQKWKKGELEFRGFADLVDWPWQEWLQEKYGSSLYDAYLSKEATGLNNTPTMTTRMATHSGSKKYAPPEIRQRVKRKKTVETGEYRDQWKRQGKRLKRTGPN
ncbi:hypothetical protein TRVA0_029S01288 [Trichomonascus vanleenenianus]|uniref:uncharacterized protein n=1 Tax=Trichomonascus vanleenenianus TaxID=2268995 RepID=UPI003EC98402